MTTTHAPGGAPEGTRERTTYTVTIDLWAHEDTGIASVGVRNTAVCVHFRNGADRPMRTPGSRASGCETTRAAGRSSAGR